jgi:hypothetical protein
LRIDEHGNLTIHPIGIKGVPRRWELHGEGETGPDLVSKDRWATVSALVEPLIVLKKAGTKTGTGVKTKAEGAEAGINHEHPPESND